MSKIFCIQLSVWGELVKGTVSRDFLLCFFIKQLVLVPSDMQRKDFEFFANIRNRLTGDEYTGELT
jgi:hypothetical protein